MNYLQIRPILAFYKTFYDCRQTTIRTSHTRIILKHSRLLLRLKDSLIKLSPDLTEQEKTTIDQDYHDILAAIYYHLRRPHRCRLLYTLLIIIMTLLMS
jgi:hypothetical protein